MANEQLGGIGKTGKTNVYAMTHTMNLHEISHFDAEPDFFDLW
jgi:hypothetical protein